MDMTTATDVGLMAQSEAKLPLNEIALIGIFTGPGGDSALIRAADGHISKVAAGDRAGGLTVQAIADDGLHLTDRRGQSFVLTIPG